jgi:hypothetical protein
MRIIQAWAAFLEAQKIIATATQFVSDLEATIKLNSGSLDLWDRMAELERTIEPLVNEAETWAFHSSGSPASVEEDVARNLRLMARIKLNRYVGIIVVLYKAYMWVVLG